MISFCIKCDKPIPHGTPCEYDGAVYHLDCLPPAVRERVADAWEREQRKHSLRAVDHPDHYGGADNPYEAIKVIRAWGFGVPFCLGNVIKYVSRAGKKGDQLEDLKKARKYLDFAIDELEATK